MYHGSCIECYLDGTDDSDRKLLSGVYFVRLEAGNYTRIEKAVLLK
ncbi:MAG: hypothetical protein N3A65_08425 [candidate division WOR-3 bacterium]|nr:hypothetical protein [candidate division WOR-3 bacterium]